MAETVRGRSVEYTGTKQPENGERGANGELLVPYLPNADLVEAVNLAMYLERPLLLKGEPGCGKTQLAVAVAYELGLNLEFWAVKSTSRARDGLYVYDAVGRLRDAQLANSNRLTEAQIQKLDDPTAYVRWGALGKAFRAETCTVTLIDEIDKADIDFPNDLLLELDQRRFTVEETGQVVKARVAPIVIITSNDEKDLPDAFLRRCLFHYVEFPRPDRLMQIVQSRFPEASLLMVEQAIARFLDLRDQMRKDKGEAGKKVSTSELLDWFQVLRRYPEDEALQKLKGKLPFAGILLKSWPDHLQYLQ
jgi:MoxR-like ATPase